jgi:hypothetical protein
MLFANSSVVLRIPTLFVGIFKIDCFLRVTTVFMSGSIPAGIVKQFHYWDWTSRVPRLHDCVEQSGKGVPPACRNEV